MIRNILLFITLALCFCSPKRLNFEPAIIPAAYEKLYLAPLISEAQMEQLDGWPYDAPTQQILMNYILGIQESLKEEFLRCEKFGYYEMVEDTQSCPTMRISVTLLKADLRNDTLKMPVNMRVERLPDGKEFIYSLTATSTSPKKSDPLNYLKSLLNSYKQRFPYKELVSFFYPHYTK
ncbi:MAG: hypothetical protein GX267_04875 [Fibrobacter sp.]|jgi:hypothetical protein|nr:hypothetical protein [Fibrobacter sp.]